MVLWNFWGFLCLLIYSKKKRKKKNDKSDYSVGFTHCNELFSIAGLDQSGSATTQLACCNLVLQKLGKIIKSILIWLWESGTAGYIYVYIYSFFLCFSVNLNMWAQRRAVLTDSCFQRCNDFKLVSNVDQTFSFAFCSVLKVCAYLFFFLNETPQFFVISCWETFYIALCTHSLSQSSEFLHIFTPNITGFTSVASVA